MRSFAILLIDITIWLSGKILNLLYYLLGSRFIYLTGKLTGDFFYFLNSRERKITETELSSFFGNRFDRVKIKDITRRSFENYYKRQIETIFFGRLGKQKLNRIVHAEGIENLDMVLSEGKGVILLLSHFGSFLLPLPFLGYMGYKVNQATGKQRHASLIAERIWVWRKKEADRLPVKFIQVDKFLRPIYEALGNNELVAIAFDGRDGSNWVTVDFFDKKVSFSTGPFELARRTGAKIIPTFIIRNEDNTHNLVMEPPFKLSDNPDLDKAVTADTINYTEIFAGYVSRYPCHFGMALYKLRT